MNTSAIIIMPLQLHSLLQRLEPWAWACSLICWVLFTFLDVKVPPYGLAILFTGMILGPIVSLGRRSFVSVPICISLVLIAFAQSYPPLQLPRLIACLLAQLLFGVLWWVLGRAYASVLPLRFWEVVVYWSYRSLAIAAWGTVGFLTYYIAIQGFQEVIPQFINTLSVINGLVVLGTIPLTLALPAPQCSP